MQGLHRSEGESGLSVEAWRADQVEGLGAGEALRSREVYPPLMAGAAPLGILHFNDGVRLGPMYASVSGIMQFKAFIDLTGAQLDELMNWWAAVKEAT